MTGDRKSRDFDIVIEFEIKGALIVYKIFNECEILQGIVFGIRFHFSSDNILLQLWKATNKTGALEKDYLLLTVESCIDILVSLIGSMVR